MDYGIGIDVGGTKIAAGIVSLATGEVLHSVVTPTLPSRKGSDVLQDLTDMVIDLRGIAAEKGVMVDRLGLGIPELVGIDHSQLSFATLAWQDIPVYRQLSRIFPTTIEADVRAAALAEAKFGAGCGKNVFLYVTVGTGISCCLVINGRPFTGARGLTGTFASKPLVTPTENRTTHGGIILEEFASGPALLSRYNRRNTAQQVASTAEVLNLANEGEYNAMAVVQSAATALGGAVGHLINVLDPECVVFGGGLGLIEGMWWSHLRESIQSSVWAPVHRQIQVLHAALGRHSGMIGAALAAQPSIQRTTQIPAPQFA